MDFKESLLEEIKDNHFKMMHLTDEKKELTDRYLSECSLPIKTQITFKREWESDGIKFNCKNLTGKILTCTLASNFSFVYYVSCDQMGGDKIGVFENQIKKGEGDNV